MLLMKKEMITLQLLEHAMNTLATFDTGDGYFTGSESGDRLSTMLGGPAGDGDYSTLLAGSVASDHRSNQLAGPVGGEDGSILLADLVGGGDRSTLLAAPVAGDKSTLLAGPVGGEGSTVVADRMEEINLLY